VLLYIVKHIDLDEGNRCAHTVARAQREKILKYCISNSAVSILMVTVLLKSVDQTNNYKLFLTLLKLLHEIDKLLDK